MKTEIERKFLVRGDAWRNTEQRVLIRQGYLSLNPERIVRVRLAEDHAFLTIKGLAVGYTRPEYEYAIPVSDAEFLLENLCRKPLIEKYRYSVLFSGAEWIVDEFLGANTGLIVAEIELKTEDEPFILPNWVTKEVTHDLRYMNSNLTLKPYQDWHA